MLAQRSGSVSPAAPGKDRHLSVTEACRCRPEQCDSRMESRLFLRFVGVCPGWVPSSKLGNTLKDEKSTWMLIGLLRVCVVPFFDRCPHARFHVRQGHALATGDTVVRGPSCRDASCASARKCRRLRRVARRPTRRVRSPHRSVLGGSGCCERARFAVSPTHV